MLGIKNTVDMQSETEEPGEVVMGLVISSGQARSLTCGALKMVKWGDFESAKTMIDQSHLALDKAHLVRAKLIEDDQGEGEMKVSLALVHAQDHLMASMLTRELMTRLIEPYKRLKQQGVHNAVTN